MSYRPAEISFADIAAPNATMPRKFTPSPAVRRPVIFADADDVGLKAAADLTKRMQDQLQVEVRTPSGGVKDWNDVLLGAT